MSLLLGIVSAGVPGTDYTLDVIPGSFDLTGVAAAISAQRNLSTSPATYSATVSAVALVTQRKLSTSPTSYSITTSAVSEVVSRKLPIVPGSYSITAASASLAGSRKLTTTPTSYPIWLGSATGPISAPPGTYESSRISNFTRASTATYVDSAGIIQTAAIDAPRVTYHPTSLALQGTLIEGAASNLIQRSSDLSHVYWGNNNATVTPDDTIAPDGTLTADKVENLTGTITSLVSKALPVPASSTNDYYASIFVKPISPNDDVTLNCYYGGGAPQVNVTYQFSTLTISGSPPYPGEYIFEQYPNGWYRIGYRMTRDPTGVALAIQFRVWHAGRTDISGGAYLWGAQFELGATATSYIPTISSVVSRSADNATLDTSNVEIVVDRKLPTVPASFAITASDVQEVVSRKLEASPTTFTITGSPSNFILARKILTTPGSFTISGASANSVAVRKLYGSPATFTITGASAGLSVAHKLQTVPATFVITGALADVEANRKLSTTPGVFALTGSPANLLQGRTLSTTAGIYSVTGSPASIIIAHRLNVQPVTYSVTGSPANLRVNFNLDTVPGAFTITPADVRISAGRFVKTLPTSFAVTNPDAKLTATRVIDTSPAAFIITGANSNFVVTKILNTSPGSFAYTGNSASIVIERRVSTTVLEFNLTGSDTVLRANRRLDTVPPDLTSYLGFPANLWVSRSLPTTAGNYVITGAPISTNIKIEYYKITPEVAMLLEEIAHLHGLKVPMVVNPTQRIAGELTQSLTQVNSSTFTVNTIQHLDEIAVHTPEQNIIDLARIHGLVETLTVTDTSRTAGPIIQTISSTATNGTGTSTVTRIV